MIYVTVGNHTQPFDRLLAAMDRIAATGIEMAMQTGFCAYAPRHARAMQFFPFDEAEKMIENAEVVVGHAGIGTVISARKFGTPLIICPRRAALGEHFNDHQTEICAELAARPRPGVHIAMTPEEIGGLLNMARRQGRQPAAADPAAGLKAAIGGFLDTV